MTTIKELERKIKIKEDEIKILRNEIKEFKRKNTESIIEDIRFRICKLRSANIEVKNINVSSELYNRMDEFRILRGLCPIGYIPLPKKCKFMGIDLYENYHLNEFEYYIGV